MSQHRQKEVEAIKASEAMSKERYLEQEINKDFKILDLQRQLDVATGSMDVLEMIANNTNNYEMAQHVKVQKQRIKLELKDKPK